MVSPAEQLCAEPPCPGRGQFSLRGHLCSYVLHPFSLLSLVLEVEKVKPSALFDLGLVVFYSFTFGHEYFCVSASAYVVVDRS